MYLHPAPLRPVCHQGLHPMRHSTRRHPGQLWANHGSGFNLIIWFKGDINPKLFAKQLCCVLSPTSKSYYRNYIWSTYNSVNNRDCFSNLSITRHAQYLNGFAGWWCTEPDQIKRHSSEKIIFNTFPLNLNSLFTPSRVKFKAQQQLGFSVANTSCIYWALICFG